MPRYVEDVRRLFLVGLPLLALPALTLAGTTAKDGTDTLRIKASFDPAKASSRSGGRRPVAVKLDYFAGTTDGSRLPDLRSVSVFLGGARRPTTRSPKCDETDALQRGKRACPKGSRVGRGTAIGELHPPESSTERADLKMKVTVFNGRLDTDRRGAPSKKVRDGLLLYGEVRETSSQLAFPFWAEDGNTRVTYYNPKNDPVPPGDNSLYTMKEIHITFARKTRRRGGRRIPFVAAPRRCKRRWKVTATNDRYDGGDLTAGHRVRCGRA